MNKLVLAFAILMVVFAVLPSPTTAGFKEDAKKDDKKDDKKVEAPTKSPAEVEAERQKAEAARKEEEDLKRQEEDVKKQMEDLKKKQEELKKKGNNQEYIKFETCEFCTPLVAGGCCMSGKGCCPNYNWCQKNLICYQEPDGQACSADYCKWGCCKMPNGNCCALKSASKIYPFLGVARVDEDEKMQEELKKKDADENEKKDWDSKKNDVEMKFNKIKDDLTKKYDDIKSKLQKKSDEIKDAFSKTLDEKAKLFKKDDDKKKDDDAVMVQPAPVAFQPAPLVTVQPVQPVAAPERDEKKSSIWDKFKKGDEKPSGVEVVPVPVTVKVVPTLPPTMAPIPVSRAPMVAVVPQESGKKEDDKKEAFLDKFKKS
jgi:predicted nuclease with TOPRIM domain